jgi:hypothetical protein
MAPATGTEATGIPRVRNASARPAASVDLPAPGDPAMPRSTRSRRGQLLDPRHQTVLVDGVEVGEARRSAALTLTHR